MTLLLPPLSGPPPTEVPLEHPPLVRVICQIQFPTRLAIHKPERVSRFQELVHAEYPLLKEERIRHVVIESEGSANVKEDVVWRFFDRTRKWRVSLATGFISLDTSNYASRQDFLERLGRLLDVVEQTFDPQVALRVGLRYVDRLTGEDFKAIDRLMRDEVVGVGSGPLGQSAQHLLTETLLQTEEGTLQARWGSLPANVTHDPNLLEAADQRSWILDIDMFVDQEQQFIASELIGMTKKLAERIYTVFRWVVTDEFLLRYGKAS